MSWRVEDEPYRCPECNSDRVRPVVRSGPTGVVAPDGGAEFRDEEILICLVCGHEEPDR